MPQGLANDLSAFGAHAPGLALGRLIAATRGASESWAGKRLAFLLRGLGVRALRGRPADVESLGARMRLYPSNNVAEKRMLFTPQYFDPLELDYLSARISPDFAFVDIGANVGGYSLFVAARAGARARIVAIEPQPDIHERLVYNIRQNQFATIKTLDCAVADSEGEVTMFVNSGNRGESSIRIVPSRDGGRLVVRARRLADIVAAEKLERIDAMKLDCEGAEDLILEPFFRTAPRAVWPKSLIIEHMPSRWSMDLRAFIIAQGYREALRTRQNIIYELNVTREQQ
ncbi:MAG: FkbM family methyltransferase [Hyphomicrobiales bacterium]|nr:FkbM family methyltransferase [Hyphomicrobiales bacterium]